MDVQPQAWPQTFRGLCSLQARCPVASRNTCMEKQGCGSLPPERIPFRLSQVLCSIDLKTPGQVKDTRQRFRGGVSRHRHRTSLLICAHPHVTDTCCISHTVGHRRMNSACCCVSEGLVSKPVGPQFLGRVSAAPKPGKHAHKISGRPSQNTWLPC